MTDNGHGPAPSAVPGGGAMAALEPRLARLARLAARLCDTPAALIALGSGPSLRLGAAHGLEAAELPGALARCGGTVGITQPASADFFASVPLQAGGGLPIGIIGVMDRRMRADLDAGRIADLHDLAALAAEAVAAMAGGSPAVHSGSALQEPLSASTARAIEEQRTALDAAFGLARIGTWRRWVQSGRLELSEGAYRLCGLEPGGPELSREEFYSFVHPGDRATLAAAVAAAVAEKGSYETEFRFVGRDGRIRHCTVHGYCTLDEAGEVESVFAIGCDITERKNSERALQERTRELDAALQIGRLGTWRRRLDAPDAEISAGIYPMFGARPGELDTARASLVRHCHAEDWPHVAATIDRAAAERTGYTMQLRIIGRDGKTRHCHIQAICMPDRDGGADTFLGLWQDITDRVEVAQELQERREELARALSVARLATYRRRLATDQVEMSNEMYAILGTRPGERVLTRDDVLGAIHPDDRERWNRQAADGLATRTNYEIEIRQIGFDGVTRDCEVRVYYDIDKSGAVTSICAIMQDITARRAAEQALRERTEDLANALRIARLGTYRRRLATNEVEVSEELYPILGARPGDIAPSRESLMKYVHRDDAARWTALAAQNLATKTPYETELRLVGFDGRTRYCHVQGYHDFDAAGEVAAVCAVWQDVSERKAAERALEESGRDLEDALRMAGLGISRAWVKSGELWLSDEMHALVGAKRGEIPPVHGSLRAMIHPEDQDKAERLTSQAIATGAGGEAEARIIGLDGQTRHFIVKARSELDADGEILSVKAIWQDITERTLAEQTLRRSERLSVIGQLTGGIAHDFNNLLTVIALNLELAAEALGEGDARHRLVVPALEAARRGAELNQQLLAFAGRQPLRPVALDVAEFLAPLRTMAARTVGERYTVEFHPHALDLRCSVDRAQLESAILNLILNARDAMPEGGRIDIETSRVRVDATQVTLHPDMIAGEFVMIAVKDEGSGMSRSVVDRAFEPFFTTKDVGKGTGLGLSMVMGFVRQSGGYVTIDSEVGRGTSVRLYLPATGQTSTKATATEASTWLPGPLRTLIVEDQAAVRDVVSRVCRSIGLDVVVVASAKAALDELARDRSFELLFTDIVMPGPMIGTALAEAALQLRPDLRVLYTSGYSEQAILIKERLGPAAEFLAKPYRRTELLKALERMFDGATGRRGCSDEVHA